MACISAQEFVEDLCRSHPSRCASLLILTWLLLTAAPLSAHHPEHPGVLLLYFRQRDAAYATAMRSEFSRALDERLPGKYDLYADEVSMRTAGDSDRDKLVMDVLRERYSRANIHLVVPIGNPAVEFTRRHLAELFPEASVVYLSQDFGDDTAPAPPDHSTGIVLRFDVSATVELALKQNPKTRHITIIAGTFADEQLAMQAARRQCEHIDKSIEISYLNTVPLAPLLQRLSKLPKDGFVILVTYVRDATGDEYLTTEVEPSLSRASTEPLYVVYSPGVGPGAVGGNVHDLNAIAYMLGQRGAMVLTGTPAEKIGTSTGTFQTPMFDWRQLRRWGIASSTLPPNSVVINREPTVWERYHWWIICAIALFLLQAILISLLFIAHRRATRAESVLRAEVRLVEISSELAMMFMNASGEALERRVKQVFERLMEFFNLDRMGVFEISTREDVARLIYSNRRPGIDPPLSEVRLDDIRWLADQILSGKECVVTSLGKIPESGAKTREFIRALGIKSFAALPLYIQDSVGGVLTLTSHKAEVAWSLADLNHIRAISYVFAQALDHKLAEDARQKSDAARRQLSGLLISAQEQERATIARELHDHISQRLALLAIEIESFKKSNKNLSSTDVQQLHQLSELSASTAHDVQQLSHQLHSSQLRHLGLSAAVRGLCGEFSGCNSVRASFEQYGSAVCPVGEDISLALYRVAQESLRNASKYSHARNVKVELEFTTHELVMKIVDDGVGFDLEAATDRKGLGLISMQERMRLIGGQLSLQSQVGQGTKIEARIPLTQPADAV